MESRDSALARRARWMHQEEGPMADRASSSSTQQDAATLAGFMAAVRPPGVEVAARDEATARLIEDLQQRHARLLQAAARRGAGGGPFLPRGPVLEVIRGSEPEAAVTARSAPARVTPAIDVAPIRIEPSNAGPAVNREPPILVDYKEAARLLSLCKPKPSDTAPGQAERRGVDALKQRVASGKIPSRCIKRSGRRVQFVRVALIEWACGRGRVQT